MNSILYSIIHEDFLWKRTVNFGEHKERVSRVVKECGWRKKQDFVEPYRD